MCSVCCVFSCEVCSADGSSYCVVYISTFSVCCHMTDLSCEMAGVYIIKFSQSCSLKTQNCRVSSNAVIYLDALNMI